MSCCWDCQYKQNCTKLYNEGEQQFCNYFKTKFETFETFIRAEAKHKGFYYEQNYR